MFNTKTATVNNTEFNSAYMPVGINENVILKEVSVEVSPTGRDFLRVTFEDSEGKTAEFTEWKNEKNMWIKTDEDLQQRDNQQFGRILQVLKCYIENIPDAELNSFKDMINWVKTQLVPFIATKKKLRLKVVYDNKGYTRVSNLGIFVESMEISSDASQIRLFKRDLLERPVVADDESKASDPLASVTTESTPVSSSPADDLPF